MEVSSVSKKDHLISAKLTSDGKTLATNIYYLLTPKELQLPKPNIQKEITKTENGYRIILKTDKLAKNVFLSVDGEGFFSDNYFDLLPEERKEIEFISEIEISGFDNRFKFSTLFDTFEK